MKLFGLAIPVSPNFMNIWLALNHRYCLAKLSTSVVDHLKQCILHMVRTVYLYYLPRDLSKVSN